MKTKPIDKIQTFSLHIQPPTIMASNQASYSVLRRVTSFTVLYIPHDLVLMGNFNLFTIDSSSSDTRQLTEILLFFVLHMKALTLLLTFTDILSILGFVLEDEMFSLYQLLISFWTTFLWLLTCEFHLIIAGL